MKQALYTYPIKVKFVNKVQWMVLKSKYIPVEDQHDGSIG